MPPAPERVPATADRRFSRSLRRILPIAGPLLTVAILGIGMLPMPPHGDHALFLLIGSLLDQGGTLYVDLWDSKQPGIFFFVAVAGRLFGFSMLGVHLLELIWFGALALIMIVTLRRSFSSPLLAGLVPITTIGTYYAYSTSWMQTQVEILVALPLFLCLWFSSRAMETPRARALSFLLSGVFAGLTVSFKLVLAPIPAAFWLVAATHDVINRRPISKILIEQLLPAALGTVAVLAVIILYFAAEGSLDEVLWTFFVFPIEAVRNHASPELDRLGEAVARFGLRYSPWIALAAVAILTVGRRTPLIIWQMIAWTVVASFVILSQRLFWWHYHFLLLVVPIGVLAVRGLDVLIGRIAGAGHRRSVALAVLLTYTLLIPGFISWAVDVHAFAKAARLSDFRYGPAFLREISPTFANIESEVRFLSEPGALPGPIYVFGNPIYLLAAERNQAAPINGWSPELLVDAQWQRLHGQLCGATPAYILVAQEHAATIDARSPEIRRLLDRRYRVVHATPSGLWYRRTDDDAEACGRGMPDGRQWSAGRASEIGSDG